MTEKPETQIASKAINSIADDGKTSQTGYVAGYKAAMLQVQAMALQWRDENKAAAAKDTKFGNGMMAQRLEGAATECNAIAAEVHKLAQAFDAHTNEGTK